MFENVPIQKRLKVILGLIGFVLVLSLLYGVQVKGIFERVEELKAKTRVVDDADLAIVNRQVRLKELNAQINQLQEFGVRLQSHADLVAYVEKSCHERGLTLVRLPLESMEDVEGVQIARIDLSVEGMFHDILGLIYQLEYKDQVGSVARVALEKRKLRVRGERKEMLVAEIQMYRLQQNVTANEDA